MSLKLFYWFAFCVICVQFLKKNIFTYLLYSWYRANFFRIQSRKSWKSLSLETSLSNTSKYKENIENVRWSFGISFETSANITGMLSILITNQIDSVCALFKVEAKSIKHATVGFPQRQWHSVQEGRQGECCLTHNVNQVFAFLCSFQTKVMWLV